MFMDFSLWLLKTTSVTFNDADLLKYCECLKFVRKMFLLMFYQYFVNS